MSADELLSVSVSVEYHENDNDGVKHFCDDHVQAWKWRGIIYICTDKKD